MGEGGPRRLYELSAPDYEAGADWMAAMAHAVGEGPSARASAACVRGGRGERARACVREGRSERARACGAPSLRA
eukprot:2555029-Prymnesium_polylepis.1